jgi:hypothetical protein
MKPWSETPETSNPKAIDLSNSFPWHDLQRTAEEVTVGLISRAHLSKAA